MTDYSILLPFTAPWDARPHLHGLSRDGGRIVGCNGYMLARLPDDGTVNNLPASSVDFQAVLDKYSARETFYPLTVEAPPVCGECGGTGHALRQPCPECDGEGDFAHGSHSYECKACDGSGVLIEPSARIADPICWGCNGTGRLALTVFDKFDLAGNSYNLQLIYTLSRLPGIEVADATTNGAPALQFRFAGGGDGMLMGFTH